MALAGVERGLCEYPEYGVGSHISPILCANSRCYVENLHNYQKNKEKLHPQGFLEYALQNMQNQTECGFIQIPASLHAALSAHGGTPLIRRKAFGHAGEASGTRAESECRAESFRTTLAVPCLRPPGQPRRGRTNASGGRSRRRRTQRRRRGDVFHDLSGFEQCHAGAPRPGAVAHAQGRRHAFGDVSSCRHPGRCRGASW